MPRVIDLLRQRHPALLDAERRAFRWLQSARRNRTAVGPAEVSYEGARLARLRAENAIRRELGLDEVPERANTKAPR